MTNSQAVKQLPSSIPTIFLGTVYGQICIDNDGYLSLTDKKTKVSFRLASDSLETIAKMHQCAGEPVKVVFQVTNYIEDGYIMPMQIERIPEEYNLPVFDALIFVGGKHPFCNGNYCGPTITGNLMGHFDNNRDEKIFILNSIDAALLAGQFAAIMNLSGEPFPSEQWLCDDIIYAQLQPKDHKRYIINKIHKIYHFSDWIDALRLTSKAQPALPPIECSKKFDENEDRLDAKSKPKKRIPISTVLRRKVFKRDDFRCCDCGISAPDHPLVRLEVDHRVPVSKGGTNDIDNLQTLCWDCNNGKRDDIDHKLDSSVLSDDLWAIAS